MLRADAAQCREEWRCPRMRRPHDGSPLPEKQRDALARVARLCGAAEGELTVCPGAYVRRPEAHRTVTALRWMRAGALHLRLPHPTMAEVEALDLAQDSLAARERDELKRASQKQKGGDRG